MFVVCVDFEIKPDRLAEFMPAMIANAAASRELEPDCVQFDVCTLDSAPNHVFLYELYASRAAFDAHLQTDHFKSFDAHTADMLVSKNVRTGLRAAPE